MPRRKHQSDSDDKQRKRRREESGRERERRARRRSEDKKRKRHDADERHKDHKHHRRSPSPDRDARHPSKRPPVKDDRDGHLVWQAGDYIEPSDGQSGSYKIVRKLGEGTFGKVVEVESKGDKKYALKIVRNISKYREAAECEIKILKDVLRLDPEGKSMVIRLTSSFDYHGHACLLFPLLGLSVFDFLKSNDYLPFPMEHVRHMGRQLTEAVAFLHRNRLTHTDLKPENLVLCSSKFRNERDENGKRRRVLDNPDVILIDLGGATYEDQYHTLVVSTRHYRAPEVVLELGWSYPCDVWSIGCILFEMYTGATIFQTHDSREHLAIMERTLDAPMPEHMALKSKTKHYKDGRLDWDANSPDSRYVRDKCHRLRYHMRGHTPDDAHLFELIELMLKYDPTTRIRLDDALKHPYFEVKHPQNGSLH
ncbi:unnamed protein product, partial [Mesorhabditis spiculigera]